MKFANTHGNVGWGAAEARPNKPANNSAATHDLKPVARLYSKQHSERKKFAMSRPQNLHTTIR